METTSGLTHGKPRLFQQHKLLAATLIFIAVLPSSNIAAFDGCFLAKKGFLENFPRAFYIMVDYFLCVTLKRTFFSIKE